MNQELINEFVTCPKCECKSLRRRALILDSVYNYTRQMCISVKFLRRSCRCKILTKRNYSEQSYNIGHFSLPLTRHYVKRKTYILTASLTSLSVHNWQSSTRFRKLRRIAIPLFRLLNHGDHRPIFREVFPPGTHLHSWVERGQLWQIIILHGLLSLSNFHTAYNSQKHSCHLPLHISFHTCGKRLLLTFLGGGL